MEECKYQGRDEYTRTKDTQRKVILSLPSSASKMKDKITEGDKAGGSQKLEDSKLRKLR